MPDQKPLGPFTMTPARITILALGLLALVMIAGALLGGVGDFELLREAAPSSQASSSAP
jgi:hypothetical protein